VDVYKIAVEIALAGNLAQALTGIAAQMTGIHGKVNQIHKALGGWGTAVAAVGTLLAAGVIVKGIEDIFESTRKLSHELSQIQKMGASPSEMSSLHSATLSILRSVPGTTEAGVASLYGQTRSIFRGPEEALRALPSMSKFAQTLGQNTGDYEGANDSVFSMMRSADLIGKLSDEHGNLDVNRLQRFLDIANKVAIATHGAIGPQQWLGMAQQGGPSLRALTDDGLLSSGIIAQAMGAQRYGTASMSLMQQFAGGTMFKRNAESLQEHGLLREGEWGTSGGRVVLTDAASKRLMDMIKGDPLAFVQKLMEDYAKKGITSKDDQIRAIFRDFGRSTTQREIADVLNNINQMQQERDLIKRALSSNGAFDVGNSQDIDVAAHNLSSAFYNLKTAIGGPKNENFIKALDSVTYAINTASAFSQDHPTAMRDLGYGIAGLGAVFLTAGVVALVAAIGSGGWMIACIITLAGALATLAAVNWPSLESGIAGLINSLGDFVDKHGGAALNKLLHDHLPKDGSGNSGTGNPMDDPTQLFQRQNYAPPPRSDKPTVLKAALNIDSRQLAEAVTYALADFHEVSPNAASGNGASLSRVERLESDWLGHGRTDRIDHAESAICLTTLFRKLGLWREATSLTA
jgi:hypothetical protein